MSAFERFAAREDRLSAVLAALPFHEAPRRLAARIREAALLAEKEREEDLPFLPPDSLREAVFREAATLHAAQADRRRAFLQEVAQGKDLETLLDGPLGKEAEDWLRRAASAETRGASGESFWQRWRVKFRAGRYSPALGWAFCFVMVCGLVLRGQSPLDPPWSGESAPAQAEIMAEVAAQDAARTARADAMNPDAAMAPAPAPRSAPQSPAPEPLVSPPPAAEPEPGFLPPPAAKPGKRSGTVASGIILQKPSRPAPAATAELARTARSQAPAPYRDVEAPDQRPEAPLPAPPPDASPPARAGAVAQAASVLPSSASAREAAALLTESKERLAQTWSPESRPPSPEFRRNAPAAASLPPAADVVISYPANSEQWRKIAAVLENSHAGKTFVWRLFAGDTDNADVRALADFLRHTLPDGHTLSLHLDPKLAAAEARLERRTLKNEARQGSADIKTKKEYN
jgi:hypothetical protein